MGKQILTWSKKKIISFFYFSSFLALFKKNSNYPLAQALKTFVKK